MPNPTTQLASKIQANPLIPGRAQVNVDAADSAEAAELMSEDGAPHCFASDGRALGCSVTAERTIRSGQYELQEWARIDRPYCKSDIFRDLILDNASVTEAECRLTLRERLNTCRHGICPQCISPCNYPLARTLATVFKCVQMKRHFGFVHFYHTTDAGQLARSMHGARRKDNYIAVRFNISLALHKPPHCTLSCC